MWHIQKWEGKIKEIGKKEIELTKNIRSVKNLSVDTNLNESEQTIQNW